MKLILDSNVLIYSIQPAFQFLRDFIGVHECCVSEVTRIEVLGYHKISPEEKDIFETIFNNLNLLPIHKSVIEKAILIRQQKAMSLGDSLIAATAIAHNLPLVTRNEADFAHLNEMKIINPFKP